MYNKSEHRRSAWDALYNTTPQQYPVTNNNTMWRLSVYTVTTKARRKIIFW
jgi:hypothetical protein